MKKRARPRARQTASRSARSPGPTSRPSAKAPTQSGRPVFAFLPNRREKTFVSNVMRRAGIRWQLFENLELLVASLSDQAGALFLAEESFADDAVSLLMDRLREQPKWSDLPLIAATRGSKLPPRLRDLAGAS